MQLDIIIIINQVAQFCVLLGIGYAAVKAKIFSAEGLGTLSAFVLKIIMPAMLITKLPASTTREVLLNALPLLAVIPFWYLALGAGAYFTGKLCKMPPDTLKVHTVQYTMGNIGVMGMILIMATLGDSCAIYMAALFFVDQCMLWTVCETLSYPSGQKKKLDPAALKKVFFNPTIICLLIALLMIAFDFRPQNFVMDALTGLGAASKPVAMIFIGGTLATLDLKRLPFLNGMFYIIIFKMLLMPLAVFVVLGLLPFIDPVARMTLTLTTALPSLFAMSIMARNNGTDHQYATMTVFGTTLAGMVTIPLVSWLANLMTAQ